MRAWSSAIGAAAMPSQGKRDGVKMKKLMAGALIVCASIVLVAWAISQYVNNKQDAEWCHENGYTNYATKDGFCVGAGGKLIKVGRQ